MVILTMLNSNAFPDVEGKGMLFPGLVIRINRTLYIRLDIEVAEV